MSKQRRTADDFVRDMKAKQQQHSTPGDIEHKTGEGQSEGCSADPERRSADSRIGSGAVISHAGLSDPGGKIAHVISGQAANQGRGAADRGQRDEAAGVLR